WVRRTWRPRSTAISAPGWCWACRSGTTSRTSWGAPGRRPGDGKGTCTSEASDPASSSTSTTSAPASRWPPARRWRSSSAGMAGYGMASCSIDGNDVLAVHDAARRAVDRARAGEGPSFLEWRTMRMRGHSEADDASYVPKALIDDWRPRDPVKRFEDHLIETQVLTAAQVEALREAVLAEVDEAQAWAEASPPPDPSEVERGVYC